MKLLRLAWKGVDFPGEEITADLRKSPELRRGLCMRGEWKGNEPFQAMYFYPSPENEQRIVALAKENWKPDHIGWSKFDPAIFGERPEPFMIGLNSAASCIGSTLPYEPV